eukprot:TRINITY_DN12288_c0_g1_i3.p1 TRINITY_DN12288_c0_g1~~TRINITY_DN12288_c0_g1_i3.p1  ORF type:complete len:186 (-),score=22.55 TRINITY_DN12288_c0_g1_i3:113-670(-)
MCIRDRFNSASRASLIMFLDNHEQKLTKLPKRENSLDDIPSLRSLGGFYENISTRNVSSTDISEKLLKKRRSVFSLNSEVEERIRNWLDDRGIELACYDSFRDLPSRTTLTLQMENPNTKEVINEEEKFLPGKDEISKASSWTSSNLKELSLSESPLLVRRKSRAATCSIFSVKPDQLDQQDDGN